MDSVITISPTIFCRLSRRIRLTLIRFCFTGGAEACLAGAGFWGAGTGLGAAAGAALLAGSSLTGISGSGSGSGTAASS